MYDALDAERDSTSVASEDHEWGSGSASDGNVHWRQKGLCAGDRTISGEGSQEEIKSFGLETIDTEKWGSTAMVGPDDYEEESDDDTYSVDCSTGEDPNPCWQQEQNWYNYQGGSYSYMGYYGGGATWSPYGSYSDSVRWCWVYPYSPYVPYVYPAAAGYANSNTTSCPWPAPTAVQRPWVVPTAQPMPVSFGRAWQ